jgi:hypothetical protein
MRNEPQVRKEAGQSAAIARTGEDWTCAAIVALRRYIEARRRLLASPEFTTEEFRVWATEYGHLDEPASVNAWGAIPRLARAAGLIEWTGRTVEARRRESHARLIRIWRAC